MQKYNPKRKFERVGQKNNFAYNKKTKVREIIGGDLFVNKKRKNKEKIEILEFSL